MPEYDVVHLRVITKRSAEKPEDVDHKQVYLKAFGQDLHLNLRPNNEFNSKLKSMKVFAAESSNDGKLKYVEEPSDLESLGRTYHDDQNMAAVIVRRSSDGNFLMVSLLSFCHRKHSFSVTLFSSKTRLILFYKM